VVQTTSDLRDISERLRTQDNRITENPMFCVQIKVRDVGYDTAYCDNACWWNPELQECRYDDEPDNIKEWDGPYGYKDRWETVMVAFTEGGCKKYLDLNGHNDRRRAHEGEVRIYVESFNRCPEMIRIRESLMAEASPDLLKVVELWDKEGECYCVDEGVLQQPAEQLDPLWIATQQTPCAHCLGKAAIAKARKI